MGKIEFARLITPATIATFLRKALGRSPTPQERTTFAQTLKNLFDHKKQN